MEGGRHRRLRREAAELDSIDDYMAQAMRFNPRRDPRLLRRSLLHNLRRLPSGKWTWKTDPRPWMDVDDVARRMHGLWAELGKITCPTLVVRGAESDVFLDEHAERFARALPTDAGYASSRRATPSGRQSRALVEEIRGSSPTGDRVARVASSRTSVGVAGASPLLRVGSGRRTDRHQFHFERRDRMGDVPDQRVVPVGTVRHRRDTLVTAFCCRC
jgi:hypothetical protein